MNMVLNYRFLLFLSILWLNHLFLLLWHADEMQNEIKKKWKLYDGYRLYIEYGTLQLKKYIPVLA